MSAPDLFARCRNADARTPDGYARALGGHRASLLLTDPPYCLLTRRRKGGELRDKRAHKKIDQDPIVRFETVRDYRHFTEAWMKQALAQLLPGAPLVIWTNFLGKAPILEVAHAAGYPHLAGEYVWAKRTTAREGNEQLLRVYEVALVLLPRAPEPVGLDAPATPWAVVGGYDDDGEAARWGSHPHHKPFSVLEPLLRTWTRPGDVVLDPFSGSGSVGAAAVRLQRSAACLEVEPEWAARVSERLSRTLEASRNGA